MTLAELETRLTWVEALIAKAHPKDLPYLNDLYQKLLARIVAIDLGQTKESVTR